ncbi:NmrA/HSCARG family protein [Curtobacterium sp. MCPF17_011]|uniref:NmrA/HSCARG family protein n=1 Tax=Curtobacterium sp. MCPF17_011 TaxID=2175652 RepID=UPI000DA777B9|nr:NmrA/HSCARG family protein [Curtobacterium sp. MCPF17_011]PZF15236.1 NmrA/HSCARG family protein [Curtobacterium sp. MCPF17_011]
MSTQTTSTTPTIAVFAATGSQGGAVTDALLAAGARVRALLRDTTSEKAAALAGRGVELAQIDVHDPSSLVTALQGVDAFWFMTTPPGGMQQPDTEGETAQGIALADAAATAQVPHVVFSSVGGAERDSHVPHFESKYRVEQHLATVGLHVTVVRPVFFTDNFHAFAPTREDGTLVLRLPFPDGIPLQMIATRDVGAIAATALLDPTAVPAEIEIAGDALTGSEIAAAFAEQTGTPTRYEALPLAVLDGQDDMQAMFRWFAETPAYQADLEQVRRIAPTTWTLAQWLETAGPTRDS